jgi:hypothetical protein
MTLMSQFACHSKSETFPAKVGHQNECGIQNWEYGILGELCKLDRLGNVLHVCPSESETFAIEVRHSTYSPRV